jgi:hypothetical protein
MSASTGAGGDSPAIRPGRQRSTPARYDNTPAATPTGAAVLARATSKQAGSTPRAAAPKAGAARAGAAAAAKPSAAAKRPAANQPFKNPAAPLPPRPLALGTAPAATPTVVAPAAPQPAPTPLTAGWPSGDEFLPEAREKADHEHELTLARDMDEAKAASQRYAWKPATQKLAIGMVRRAKPKARVHC